MRRAYSALGARSRALARRSTCSRPARSSARTARRWPSTNMSIELVAVSVATAVAAGLIGSFAVIRRMSLAGDALSHVALPGIGLALMMHVEPLAGAIAALFFGALFVWAIEDRAGVGTETLIGVVFSAALAAGSLMTSDEALVEVLFGRTGRPT